MHYYVNLPLSWIHDGENWLDFFQQHRINPELGFDKRSLAFSMGWHHESAARMRDLGLQASVHLPFFGPPIGQGAAARTDGLDILKKATEVASIYDARHLIGHPSFFAHSDSDGQGVREGDIGPRPSEGWLERSSQGWTDILRMTYASLYLENTHDIGPEAVLALLDTLAAGDYSSQIGMCFDVGHWFSFAQGCDRDNLAEWLDKITPHLAHLHLHDNGGYTDQHLGLGRGRVPLEDFFRAMLGRGLRASFTMEPHDLEALKYSLEWLEKNQAMQDWLRMG